MTQSDIKSELENAPYKPLLLVEKKLIGWSLWIGIVLLAVLTAVSQFLPVTLKQRRRRADHNVAIKCEARAA